MQIDVLNKMVAKFIKFSAVGMVGTAGHYLVLIMLIEWFALNAIASSSAGAVVGALINYYFNYRWTFRSDQKHSVAATKFMTVAASGFVMNGLLMALLVEWLALHYLTAQILTTGIVLFWNFLVNYFWTFKAARSIVGR
jgi:putative flippase GtrA